jgi:hypothetical protein
MYQNIKYPLTILGDFKYVGSTQITIEENWIPVEKMVKPE